MYLVHIRLGGLHSSCMGFWVQIKNSTAACFSTWSAGNPNFGLWNHVDWGLEADSNVWEKTLSNRLLQNSLLLGDKGYKYFGKTLSFTLHYIKSKMKLRGGFPHQKRKKKDFFFPQPLLFLIQKKFILKHNWVQGVHK